MNSKLLTITAVLNVIILVASISYFFIVTEPKITLATEMAMKVNTLPKGAENEFSNYSEKERKDTFELITSLYNRLATYIESQKNYYEKALNSLTQYIYIIFLLLAFNSILLIYIAVTNGYNKAIKHGRKKRAG